MKERYKSKIAVFLVLTRFNHKTNRQEVLLQKRKNTGYMDGMYDLGCSGHLEAHEFLKEALVRETNEELGITIYEKDLELVTTIHKYEEDYLLVFFKTDKYKGIPIINEEYKCEELLWSDIDNLPDNTIYQVRIALNNIFNNINYQSLVNTI